MSRKSDSKKFSNMSQVGNFTKNAIQSFEKSIISRKNYLEEVEKNRGNKTNE